MRVVTRSGSIPHNPTKKDFANSKICIIFVMLFSTLPVVQLIMGSVKQVFIIFADMM